MSTKFTPSRDIDMSKEKEWSAGLGMLDWDDGSIVFTKRSLIEFLKSTGTTVDTNFANIQKLPRYAKIGTFLPPLDQLDHTTVSENTSPAISQGDDGFKPTRRVRTVPGGPHTDIFGHDYQDQEDALSKAPPRGGSATTSPAVEQAPAPPEQEEEEEESGIRFSSSVKNSRRVRTAPGGNSSLGSNFWDSEPVSDEFKPTRRVREGPGGQDHINNLFG